MFGVLLKADVAFMGCCIAVGRESRTGEVWSLVDILKRSSQLGGRAPAVQGPWLVLPAQPSNIVQAKRSSGFPKRSMVYDLYIHYPSPTKSTSHVGHA